MTRIHLALLCFMIEDKDCLLISTMVHRNIDSLGMQNEIGHKRILSMIICPRHLVLVP